MEFREILDFINTEDKRLIEYYGDTSLENERVFARTIKLTEEVGELCDSVLASSGLQRKEVLEKFDKDSLPKDFADVIFTTLLLAKTMGIDVEKGLKDKIEVINDRYNEVSQ